MRALYIRDASCVSATCLQAGHGQYEVTYFYLVLSALLQEI
jgi:hypothetical protein